MSKTTEIETPVSAGGTKLGPLTAGKLARIHDEVIRVFSSVASADEKLTISFEDFLKPDSELDRLVGLERVNITATSEGRLRLDDCLDAFVRRSKRRGSLDWWDITATITAGLCSIGSQGGAHQRAAILRLADAAEDVWMDQAQRDGVLNLAGRDLAMKLAEDISFKAALAPLGDAEIFLRLLRDFSTHANCKLRVTRLELLAPFYSYAASAERLLPRSSVSSVAPSVDLATHSVAPPLHFLGLLLPLLYGMICVLVPLHAIGIRIV